MDETLKQELLGRFATYLDVIKPGEADVDAAADEREEADLFSIFVELAGLRNETRTQSRLVKEAIDRFRDVFDTLQSSHTMLEQDLKRARTEADRPDWDTISRSAARVKCRSSATATKCWRWRSSMIEKPKR